MVDLNLYAQFWRDIAKSIPEVDNVMAVTVDDEMGRRLQSMAAGQTTLFWLPPVAEATGRTADAYAERNTCVVFVMEKHDPQRRPAIDVLIQSQPVIEGIKARLRDSAAACCQPFIIDPATIRTEAETQFYRSFTGWSLSFTIKT